MRSFALSRARDAKYPGLFQELKQFIGEEAAAELSKQYGGTRLYIPGTLKPEHPLLQLLGQQVAQRLADEFGGMTVEIPRSAMRQNSERNAHILADRGMGMSQRKLALRYQLTVRTIRTIINSK